MRVIRHLLPNVAFKLTGAVCYSLLDVGIIPVRLIR